MKYGRRNRQRGVTLPEMGLYVGVLAILGVVVAAGWGNVQAGIRVEQAYGEVIKVMAAAQAYRAAPANQGSLSGIGITALVTDGYNVRPFTDGTAENTYGLNIVIAASGTPAGSDALLTYQTGIQADCLQLIERFTNAPGIKATPAPACATGTLTITIE